MAGTSAAAAGSLPSCWSPRTACRAWATAPQCSPARCRNGRPQQQEVDHHRRQDGQQGVPERVPEPAGRGVLRVSCWLAGCTRSGTPQSRGPEGSPLRRCTQRVSTHVMQYAVAASATSTQQTTTKAGSSLAHWFFVCLWYDVCRYLRRAKQQSLATWARPQRLAPPGWGRGRVRALTLSWARGTAASSARTCTCGRRGA